VGLKQGGGLDQVAVAFDRFEVADGHGQGRIERNAAFFDQQAPGCERFFPVAGGHIRLDVHPVGHQKNPVEWNAFLLVDFVAHGFGLAQRGGVRRSGRAEACGGARWPPTRSHASARGHNDGRLDGTGRVGRHDVGDKEKAVNDIGRLFVNQAGQALVKQEGARVRQIPVGVEGVAGDPRRHQVHVGQGAVETTEHRLEAFSVETPEQVEQVQFRTGARQPLDDVEDLDLASRSNGGGVGEVVE
jgi:hypothetical protein